MQSARFPLLLSIILTGLSACQVTSTSSRSLSSLPAQWKNSAHFPVASPARDLSRWWSRFEDPTLSRIISTALKNSPDMASASARIKESRARRNSTRASLFPSLGSSASTDSNTSERKSFGRNSDTSYTAGLNASWEMDLFGKVRSEIEADSARLGASEENFNSVQASLAAEVAIAYTNLRADQAELQILLGNVKTREETSQLASWRTQAGEADALESSQALSSLEQARASVPLLQQRISQAHNLIALLSGNLPGSLDSVLSSGKKSIPDPPRSLAIGIPADTLRQRPDVCIAGYQLLAAAASTRAADAQRYPSLNLSGSLGLNTLTASKLFNPETATAGIIAGITSPIFDAGRIRSNIEAQNAAEEQAYQAYRSTVLTALSEVEDSLIACRRTAEQLVVLQKATASAREADQIARQRYETGEIDFVSVLDTQRSLLGLESSLLAVRADRTIAYIQLYKALGGGWSAGL